MGELTPEWVSAAVDGEANSNDELTEIQRHAQSGTFIADKQAHQLWSRYHMIGDGMRDDLPAECHLDLAGNIAAAIAEEPPLTPYSQNIDPSYDRQSAHSQDRNAVPLFVSLLKQSGQYAIAAGVAVFAVIGVQHYQQPVEDMAAASPVLVTRPVVGGVSPVSLQTAPVNVNQSYTNDQTSVQQRRINHYIQDHMLQQRLYFSAATNDDRVMVPRATD